MNPANQAIRAARLKTELTLDEFARFLEVSTEELGAWEMGAREAPSRALVRCARALALTVEELLDENFALAPLPEFLLRAKRDDRQDDALELSEALALFAEGARAIVQLRRSRGVAPPSLPTPPSEAKWGTGAPPYLADELAGWLRAELGIATPGVPSLRAVYETLGVPIVWARQDEMNAAIDGAALLQPQAAVLVHLVEGSACWWRTRMTLAHELCHLLCDLAGDKQPLALVSLAAVGDPEAAMNARHAPRRASQLFKGFDWIEQRASAFASHFLVPDDALKLALAAKDPTSEDAVSTVCHSFGVGRITAVNRITHVYGFRDDLRSAILRRPHDDKHAADHPDLAPAIPGTRAGVLLDEVALALVDGRIDRTEAHRILGLPLSEPLPNHPSIPEAARRALRSVEDDVRTIVEVRLARDRRTGARAGTVTRDASGWSVVVTDPLDDTVAPERLSFDLEDERAKLSA